MKVLFIDKPVGITSNKVCEIVKRILNEKKVGHTGTLDPYVSGMLILLIGKTTRLYSIFNLPKTYVGIGKLHKDVGIKKIREVIKEKFTGEIQQIPPKRSRVKRVLRKRKIYEFKILEKEGRYFLFKVRCEAGTYIRKLLHDLGSYVGGCQMIELRRIGIGRFKEDMCKSLEELEKSKEKCLIDVEKIIKYLPYKKVKLKKDQAKRFCYGGFVKYEKGIKENEKVLVLCKKRLIGVGIVMNGYIKPEIVLFAANEIN
jgi:predicted rRNA pseudouridine synthase